MSSWHNIRQWQRYVSREGCPVCNQEPNDQPNGEMHIADLTISTLGTDSNTCMKGHCCLVVKPHAVELYDLSSEDAAAFMSDIQMAARALKKVTGAIKINYEIHGNTIPHLHMHLWPRQIGDRFEDGPIDWRLRDPGVYGEGEYESFVRDMQEAIMQLR
ncbi:MAG: HIT family protein [Armatimonadota bacterium]